MRRIITIVALLSMIISLAGCGGKIGDSSGIPTVEWYV